MANFTNLFFELCTILSQSISSQPFVLYLLIVLSTLPLGSPEEAPCTMQHYWSGGFFPEYGASLLRYYVDGEANASVVLPLGMAHGMAADMDDNAPWNAGDIMGKTGVGYVNVKCSFENIASGQPP